MYKLVYHTLQKYLLTTGKNIYIKVCRQMFMDYKF